MDHGAVEEGSMAMTMDGYVHSLPGELMAPASTMGRGSRWGNQCDVLCNI